MACARNRLPKDIAATVTKGAALIMRGQHEVGGNLLADVWRSNNGQVPDAELLAYLTIAAHRIGDTDATQRFRSAFGQINRSARLQKLVAANAG